MEKLGKFAISLFLGLFFVAIDFAAAEFKVKSYLSSPFAEVGDVVSFTIELISDEEMRSPGENFSPPQIAGLEFQGVTKGSSTSMSYTNGSMSRSYTLTYNINYAAEKEGVFVIPATDLDVKEKLLTKKAVLKVYKTLPANLQNQRQKNSRRGAFGGGSGSLMDQIFGAPQRQARSQEPLEFFTEVEINKTEVYKGEQFTAAWYIYVTPGASLGTFDTLRFPTLKGFWKEDVNFASRFYWKRAVKDGKPYMRALLSSYALTPYKPGSYMIDPFELRAVVNKGFFNGSRKILKAKSDPVAITVKPLPKPIPDQFLGGVGRFKIDSVRATTNRNVLTGEPFDVSFRVVGDESATKFLEVPKIDVGDVFKVYKVKEDHKFVPSRISSYKAFKYSLIPKKPGVYRFPDLKLTFLDSETGEYYDEYVKLPTYKVTLNKNAPAVSDEVFEDIQKSPEDLRADTLTSLSYREYGQGTSLFTFLYSRLSNLWTVLILILSCLGGVFLFRKTAHFVPVQENLSVELERRALDVAELLKGNKRNQALSELINILSLLVGAVNGKRYGAEKEIELAVQSLPAGLKSSGLKLRKLNDDLQEMRFGTSLESYTNKAKLETCLKEFKILFLEFREYLR